MKNYVLLCLLMLIPLIVACQNDDSPSSVVETDEPTDVVLVSDNVDGERLYIIYCANCHGVEGEGSATDPNIPAHDDTGHTWHHDDDLLVDIITNGGMSVSMPAFGQQLSPMQIEAILEYIKTFWTDEPCDYQTEITNTIRSGQ